MKLLKHILSIFNYQLFIVFIIHFQLLIFNCFSQSEDMDSLTANGIKGFNKLANKDSLLQAYRSATDTLEKAKILSGLCLSLEKQNPDTALYYNNVVLSLTKNRDQLLYGFTLHLNGRLHKDYGNYKEAIQYNLQALSIFDAINQQGMNDSVLNLKSNCYINLGIIYDYLGDPEKALHYYQKDLEIDSILHNQFGKAAALVNIGLIYLQQQKLQKAEDNFNEALQLYQLHGFSKGLSAIYNNMAGVYFYRGEYQKAVNFALTSAEIDENNQDFKGASISYKNVGELYLEQQQYEKSIYYVQKSILLAEKVQAKEPMMQAYSVMSQVLEARGDDKGAYDIFLLYAAMKDSLFSESKSKEIGRLEAKYEMEKKQEEEERLKTENLKLENQKKERKDNIQYSIIFIIILAVFGTVLSLGFIKVSPKFAEGLIFFAFLIFFEFCLVILDTYVDQYSDGEPAYKLLFNAVLAGAIFPAHAFFERVLKKRLINVQSKQ